jgi:hypothetical protein
MSSKAIVTVLFYDIICIIYDIIYDIICIMMLLLFCAVIALVCYY